MGSMPVHTQLYANRTRTLIERAFRMSPLGPGVISFTLGWPDPPSLPTEELSKISHDVLLDKSGPRSLGYQLWQGYTGLREALAERARRDDGVSVGPQNFMITSGSSQAIELICRMFLEPNDVVLVEAPTFLGAVKTFLASEARCIGVPLDADGIVIKDAVEILENLRREGVRPKVFYVIPNFQNPAGVTLSLERRKALVGLAEKYGFVIVEDDAYGELRYDGQSVPSIFSLDTRGHAIKLGTFSKTMAGGLRLGWAMSNQELISDFASLKMDTGSNPFGSHLAASYWTTGLFDSHVAQLKDIYRAKRDAMLEGLERHCPAGVKWNKPDGGFFIWLELPKGMDSVGLLPKAIEHGVAFLPGNYCYADDTGENFIRLSYSFVSVEEVAEGTRRLCEVLAQAIEEQSVVPAANARSGQPASR